VQYNTAITALCMAVGYVDTKVDLAGTGRVTYSITCIIQVNGVLCFLLVQFASGIHDVLERSLRIVYLTSPWKYRPYMNAYASFLSRLATDYTVSAITFRSR
jgi:hypothetical protein